MARSSCLLSVFVLSAIVGCSASAGRPDAPDPPAAFEAAEVTLRIELRVEKSLIKPGEEPRFRADLVNDGTEPVTVVLPGDGSECGMRTPVVRWNPPMRSEARCGNINPLEADEVVTLKAGQRVPLTGWLGWSTLSGPGKHKVSLELENIPDLQWSGVPLGKHDPAAMEKVRRSPRFKAKSNVVEVEVRE